MFIISFVSFCVPGTGVLAILAGPVFGTYAGFFIVHCCSITGACISFQLSMRLGAGPVKERFPEKFAWFEK